MTCDRLVCANCAGPVNEGRCAVCRAHRERLHRESPLANLSPVTLFTVLLTLLAVALVAQRVAAA
jgi:hypothetical protein